MSSEMKSDVESVSTQECKGLRLVPGTEFVSQKLRIKLKDSSRCRTYFADFNDVVSRIVRTEGVARHRRVHRPLLMISRHAHIHAA